MKITIDSRVSVEKWIDGKSTDRRWVVLAGKVTIDDATHSNGSYIYKIDGQIFSVPCSMAKIVK